MFHIPPLGLDKWQWYKIVVVRFRDWMRRESVWQVIVPVRTQEQNTNMKCVCECGHYEQQKGFIWCCCSLLLFPRKCTRSRPCPWLIWEHYRWDCCCRWPTLNHSICPAITWTMFRCSFSRPSLRCRWVGGWGRQTNKNIDVKVVENISNNNLVVVKWLNYSYQ